MMIQAKWAVSLCVAGLLTVLATLVCLPNKQESRGACKEDKSIAALSNKPRELSPTDESMTQAQKVPSTSHGSAPDANDIDESKVIATEKARSELLFSKALERASDADSSRRIDAARKLAAFPNSRTETEFIRLATTDNDSKVREQAVRGFAIFENPSPDMWRTLFLVLRDTNPDVQLTATSVLRSFLFKLEKTDPRMPQFLWEIRQAQFLSNLTPEVRQELQTLGD